MQAALEAIVGGQLTILAPNGVCSDTAVMEGKVDSRLTPARRTVLPLPRTSQARPRRGEKSHFSGAYKLECGNPGPTCAIPPGAVGSNVPRWFCISWGEPIYSYRTPGLKVSLGVMRQVS